jgi:hypothetical protein
VTAHTDRRPLTPAQRRTAAELPWYRAWLLSTGRTEAELEPNGNGRHRDPRTQ